MCKFMAALKERGVLASYTVGLGVRMVTHYGITAEDVDKTLNILDAVTGELARAG